MKFPASPLLGLIAIGCLIFPLPAVSDVGPLQVFKGGGVVAPQSPHQSIRLDSQEVTIRLKITSYVVDVVFNLFNTGETITESIGFPKWVASRIASYPTFIRFEGSVNGDAIKFNEEWDLSGGRRLRWNTSTEQFTHLASKPMKEDRQWLVSQITFPGHERTIIRVTYEAPYHGKHFREASYIYGTGSLWKDNIEKAVFVVDAAEIGGTEKTSSQFEKGFGPEPISEHLKHSSRPIQKNIVRYELRDFKPHPEAFLRIKLNESLFGHKANYIRSKPLPGEPALPSRVRIKK